MKLIDIYSLPDEERQAYMEKLYDILMSKGVNEWISRMRWLIDVAIPSYSTEDDIDLKEKLLEFKNYTVEYTDGRLDCIKSEWSRYDSISCQLGVGGFRVDYRPEHEGNTTLINIDGIEEFIAMTDSAIKDTEPDEKAKQAAESYTNDFYCSSLKELNESGIGCPGIKEAFLAGVKWKDEQD